MLKAYCILACERLELTEKKCLVRNVVSSLSNTITDMFIYDAQAIPGYVALWLKYFPVNRKTRVRIHLGLLFISIES